MLGPFIRTSIAASLPAMSSHRHRGKHATSNPLASTTAIIAHDMCVALHSAVNGPACCGKSVAHVTGGLTDICPTHSSIWYAVEPTVRDSSNVWMRQCANVVQ
jgi:hypothetical protein